MAAIVFLFPSAFTLRRCQTHAGGRCKTRTWISQRVARICDCAAGFMSLRRFILRRAPLKSVQPYKSDDTPVVLHTSKFIHFEIHHVNLFNKYNSSFIIEDYNKSTCRKTIKTPGPFFSLFLLDQTCLLPPFMSP